MNAPPTAAAEPRAERVRVLAHRDDIHCVVFHALALLGFAASFYIYQRSLAPEGFAGIRGPWSRFAFVLAAGMMNGWVSGIDVGVNFHNHAHKTVFTRPWLNRWFGRIWPVTGGWPSFFWQHAHVTVHHANLLGPTDWTLPKRRADGRFENIYKYSVMHWPWRATRDLWNDFRGARGDGGVRRQAAKEFAIFAALWSIPFFIDPVMAIGLWVFPQFLGNCAVMGPGMYAQHAGCVEKSPTKPYSHSTTFISKFFNLTMFNIGFHIEHHDNPNVHWSALPRLHEKMRAEYIANGAHIVDMGYYRAGQLLCAAESSPEAWDAFAAQAPGYSPAPSPTPAGSPAPRVPEHNPAGAA